jgi:hypothetical protein
MNGFAVESIDLQMSSLKSAVASLNIRLEAMETKQLTSDRTIVILNGKPLTHILFMLFIYEGLFI